MKIKFSSLLVLATLTLPIINSRNSKDKLMKQDKLQILYAKKSIGSRGWSIYNIDKNGNNSKVVIPFKKGMGEYNPSVSPNKENILFNTYRYGGWKLATFNCKNKAINRIGYRNSYYTNGVYSPDGNKIAYERNIGRSTHVFMANKDGSNEQQLSYFKTKENRVPIFSPNGESIWFYSENNGINDIYQVNIKTKEIKNISNNNEGNDFSPAVSPDGKQIAFLSDRLGYLDVYIMNANGSNQRCLTNSLHNKNNAYNYFKDSNLYWMFKVSWSPDGKTLVFTNTKSNNMDLFIINSDGTNLKQVTNTPESEITPTWARS